MYLHVVTFSEFLREISMKKVILLVIILLSLTTTPCLAQIEPNAFFTLDRTLWSQSGVTETIGFYRNKAYICFGTACASMPNSAYIDLPFCSLFIIQTEGFKMNGLLFPFIGIGSGTNSNTDARYDMFKISDSWTPSLTITADNSEQE